MSDVTQILFAIEQGDERAAEKLLPLIYDELKKLAAARMAAERPGHTLQPTALVHEAYLRLVDGTQAQQWDSRGHFFAAAAEAMRRILMDHARDRNRLKREGGWQRIDLENVDLGVRDADPLSLDEALERLAAADERSANLVKLRCFAGLSLGEAAALLHLPRRTADRCWAFARAWLFKELRGGGQPEE
jgi:RNA polymerase sigma factor (TIGR02999 family)